MTDLSGDSMNRPEAERVFEEYLGRLEQGEDVDFEALCREHADIAGTLRHMKELFGAVGAVGAVGASGNAGAETPTPATSSGMASSTVVPVTKPIGSVLFQSSLPLPPMDRPGKGQLGPGDRVDDFELVQCIGRGGMGEVWEATQGALQRRVALKLLVADRVDPRVLEYFRREARAGGRLSHPGIVAVYGNGAGNGLHWIAMELVPGACDVRRSLDALAQQEALPQAYYTYVAEFVAGAADALEVAHQAGVIHRDLKPGNLLVTPDDQPKVSDFGLAKLVDERSLSAIGDLAGTYYYMSPEQIAAKRAGLDTRTDIFSLGVVLYEMLTLVRPFDGDTPEQVTRKIMWEDPPNPQKLRSRIPRDLVVICGKAMEKDRTRRYQSMAEFAADLRRHVAGQTVHARPAGIVLRSAKWGRRNPTKSVAMVIAAIALVAISAIAWELQISRQSAEAARAQAERVADFQGRILRDLDSFAIGQVMVEEFEERLAAQSADLAPGSERDEDLAAQFRALALRAPPVDVAKALIDEVILTPAAADLEKESGGDPEVEAALREALAGVYHDLTLLPSALAQQERVVALRRENAGETHPETLRSLRGLAGITSAMGQYREAAEQLAEVLEGMRAVYHGGHEEVLDTSLRLATLLRFLGENERGIALLEAAMNEARFHLAVDHKLIRSMERELGRSYLAGGDPERAGVLHHKALEDSLRIDGEVHERTLEARFDLGRWHYLQQQLPEAEQQFRAAWEATEQLKGKDHPTTLTALTGVTSTLLPQGKMAEALALTKEISGRSRRVLGEQHRQTMTYVLNEAGLLLECRQFDEARAKFEEAVEYFGRDKSTEATLRRALQNMALLEWRMERWAAAEERFREVLALTPPEHPEYAQSQADVQRAATRRRARAGGDGEDR